MSVVVSPSASDKPTPIAPKRSKRANSVSKQQQRIGVETSESKSSSQDGAKSRSLKRPLPPPRSSRAPPASNNQRRSSTCSSDRSASPTPSENESSTVESFSRVSPGSPRREEWIKSGAKSLTRIENYYSRTGPEMRRKTSAPVSSSQSRKPSTNVLSLYPLALQNSCATTTSTTSATPSPTHATAPSLAEKESPTRSKPPLSRPPAVPTKGTTPSRPSRPPRPPPSYSCTAKTAPLTQLYGTTNTIVVIDTKAADKSDEKTLRKAPRNYGRMTTRGQVSNKDDAAKVYGKKTQVALNKLVATVKKFQGSTGSGSQRTTSARKPNAKVPPKRPPPAVRNTPRPPVAKTVSSANNSDCSDETPYASFSVDSNEENPYAANSYDDHIYMEVGKKAFKSNVKCYSEGSGSGIEEDNEEDPYVVMNPGEDSHIYTPLAFGANKSTEVYDALNVTRIDKESATTSLEATDHLEDDNLYVSPEELKRYEVVTTVGDEDEYNYSTIEDGEETYENMSYGDDYDDANYEAVDYENAIVVLAKKQSTGELSSPSN